jgi:hypothetical protein
LITDLFRRQRANPALTRGEALRHGAALLSAELTAKPSYIDPRQFATAFMDVADLMPGSSVSALQAKLTASVTDPQLNKLLNGIVARADGNINRIKD